MESDGLERFNYLLALVEHKIWVHSLQISLLQNNKYIVNLYLCIEVSEAGKSCTLV